MVKDKTPKTESNLNNSSVDEIRISAPWRPHHPMQAISRGVRQRSTVDPNHFLTERSRVHEVYIREQEKTRRLSLFLSAVLLLAACLVVVFAPAGRENVSSWVGAALLASAAGAAGYKRIWGRSKNMSLGADQGQGRNGVCPRS
jgi:hypothetical protein